MPRQTQAFNCSAYAQVIAHELKLKESDLPRMMRGTGLSTEALYSGNDFHMDGPQLIRVIHNARKMCSEPDIGLRCAAHLRPATHGPVGFLSNNAPDLHSALILLEDFSAFKPPFVRFRVDFHKTWLRCTILMDPALTTDIQRIILEGITLAIQTSIESFTAAPFEQGRFLFTYPAPDYQHQYPEYFNSAVTFSASHNALLIPAEFARIPRQSKNPHAYALAHKFCVKLLEQIPEAPLDIVNRVRHLLLTHSVGSLKEEDVARALFISKRTLARRLAEYELTYRQLRENLLTELAAQYLADDSLSVEAIAAILGYHDAANFRRAFRRWHGLTPSAYRQQFTRS